MKLLLFMICSVFASAPPPANVLLGRAEVQLTDPVPLLEAAGVAAVSAALNARAASLDIAHENARLLEDWSARRSVLLNDIEEGSRDLLQTLQQHGGVTVPPDAVYHPRCWLRYVSEKEILAAFTIGPEWPDVVRRPGHELTTLRYHPPAGTPPGLQNAIIEATERSPSRRIMEEVAAFYRSHGYDVGSVGWAGEVVVQPSGNRTDGTYGWLLMFVDDHSRRHSGCEDLPHSPFLVITRTDFPDAVLGPLPPLRDPAFARGDIEPLLWAVDMAWEDLRDPAGLRQSEELERQGLFLNVARRKLNVEWLRRHRDEIAPAHERYLRATNAGSRD
jgi:hypothetical protein